jgi:Protein of unknown function (DUF2961)
MRSAIFAACTAAAAAAPFSAGNKLFGTAIKNGPIPPYTSGEWLVYNHSCGAPPCVITQIHVPSIYPGGGSPWDWENGMLRIYIDGEATPSIALTLLQLSSVGAGGAKGNTHSDVSPFSAELFGKNANTGGVWSTMRIPFQASVRVTVQQAASAGPHGGTLWIIIRGLEALTIRLAEVDLPASARLVQSTITDTVFQPNQYIQLAQSPAGTDGMMLYVFLDARSGDPNYLEGCFHIVNGDGTTQFLSSGTEDYFLSASYFDEGPFASSQAGLTWNGPGGSKSMYKTHTRDLIPFHGGMTYVWRNNEDGASCPNHWGAAGADVVQSDSARVAKAGLGLQTGPLNLTAITFFYSWPSAASA